MPDFTNKVVSIYTERTPNPENMKFVINAMLLAGDSIDYPNAEEVGNSSDFAKALFELPYVRNIFIANNFVTVGKDPEMDWYEIIQPIKQVISEYLKSEAPIVNEELLKERAVEEAKQAEANSDDDEMVQRIQEMLDKYVQPGVEMDGGKVVFKNYKEGIVTLGMQGACSGCPSSQYTLKMGIEAMMKRMIPEVKEVVAEAM